MDLENKYGVIMNTKKIRRIMNKYGIQTKVRKKKSYKEIINNVIQSMSRKGNCIDNAPMESFW